MGRPSKYPDELRERAVRMVAEVRPQYPSQWAAITAVAGMLGIGTPETLRTWIRRSEVDSGLLPGVTSRMAEENKALRREIAELRRANEILKAAAIFFGAELDRPGRRLIRFHHRAQGPPGARSRWWGRASLGCRAHVRRAV
jgi:transposase